QVAEIAYIFPAIAGREGQKHWRRPRTRAPMATKTLYDILELSSSASEDSIRAAYERLSAKFDPARPQSAGKTEANFKAEPTKEAFVTLANPATRAQYDKTLAARLQPPV